MMDHTTVSFRGKAAGNDGCLLFVEFAGNSSDVEERLVQCKQHLAGTCSVLEYASDEQSLAKIWQARKGALNDIMKMTVGSRKPIGLIEDTVVRPEYLAEHAANLLKIYRESRMDYMMFGHVGDGKCIPGPS